jgi:serine/threonine protein kinase
LIQPGTDLGGFVIESLVARGGMGDVYRARQRQPDRIVALKVISAEIADDPRFRQRFQREAAIASRIEHPNVIPVYAVGEAEGTLFIAMRLIDGVDLRRLLVEQTRLAPRRAAAIIDQVARALDAAHARGLVHRDVKPANILISSGARDHVYLCDFGVSRHTAGTTNLTRTRGLIGTIDYVAPEQIRAERVDARTDVYSLGCVLFECLTGTVPFPVDSEVAKVYAHLSEPPPSVLDRAPDLPRSFDPVLARALAKSPEDRYPSAGDLGRAAVTASSDSSAPTPQTPFVEHTAPSAADSGRRSGARRRQRPWQLAGIALLALAVIGALVLLLAPRAKRTDTETTLSLAPVAAQRISPIRNRRPLQKAALAAPGGYTYRAFLATVNLPPSAPASTRLPLYVTLQARRGAMPFVTVEQLRLPSRWVWTGTSVVTSFRLDPNPDGSGGIGVSWIVTPNEENAVTHYLTIGPQGIQVDS